tara:strand:+ start:4062 stop:5015 length:954 start_codon:yes stop_codon:yes gene_type:complete
MKRLVVHCLGILVVGLVSISHGGPGKGIRHEHKIDLQLSEEQKIQIQELRHEMRMKLKALRADGAVKDIDQMKAVHAERKERMATILTDDQYAKFETQRPRGKGRREKGMFWSKLDLTELQKDQMRALRRETRMKLKALRSDGALKDKSQMKAVHAQHKESRSAILSANQLALIEHFEIHRKEQSRLGRGKHGWSQGKSRRGRERDRLFGQLNLTEGQREQVANLRASSHAQRRQNKIDGIKLSPEQSKELRQAHREAFRAILTPDQLNALDQNKSKYGEGNENPDVGYSSSSSMLYETLPTAVERTTWGEIKTNMR